MTKSYIYKTLRNTQNKLLEIINIFSSVLYSIWLWSVNTTACIYPLLEKYQKQHQPFLFLCFSFSMLGERMGKKRKIQGKTKDWSNILTGCITTNELLFLIYFPTWVTVKPWKPKGGWLCFRAGRNGWCGECVYSTPRLVEMMAATQGESKKLRLWGPLLKRRGQLRNLLNVAGQSARIEHPIHI